MICCAVFDTNVLVSALLTRNAEAATVQVVRRMLAGEIIPLYSAEVMREYQDVLARPKFGFSPENVSYLLSALERFGILVDPSPADVMLPDLKDLPFYEVALETREADSLLVTGNLRHFPKETFVVTPRELLDILDRR